jgi:uncharacterized protein
MSSFRISVPSVTETPSPFRVQTTPEWWENARLFSDEEGLRLLEPFVLELEGHALGRRLLFRGQLSGKVELACAGCTESFTYTHREPVELLLEPLPASEEVPEGGIALDPEDLSLGQYGGETLDFEPVLVESLLLSWPMQARCSPECQGLCPDCGCNRNRESCDCEQGRARRPFEDLAARLGQGDGRTRDRSKN